MQYKSKYGYKVLYRELDGTKYKIYLVTNSLENALWNIRWYEYNTKENNKSIKNLTWYLEEIKTLKEYKKLWKGCPFSDDLS